MLLIRALDKRWSGPLTIEPPDGNTHRIQLDRGLVSRVLVPDGYARLGHIVVHAGVISDDELGEVLDREGLLGDALIRARLIDGKTLQRALLLQLLKRLTRVFSFPLETRWKYSPDERPFEGMPDGVRIDTLRALWAGISVHGEMGNYEDKALKRIGASPMRLRRGVNARRFGFTGDADQLINRLEDDASTLRELIKADITPAEVCRRLVYLLAITRHLDFTPVGEDMEASINTASSVEDMPSSEGESISAPVDDTAPAFQRVARIKLRRVAVRRAAAPDPAGSGDRSAYVAPRESEGRRPLGGPGDSSRPRAASRRDDQEIAARSEGQLETELRSRLERLERQSVIEIMGMSRSELIIGSEQQVLDRLWARYEELSRRWHPDRCPPQRPDLRAGMVKVYSAVTKGFETLADPDLRSQALFVASTDSAVEPVSSGSRPLTSSVDTTLPSLRSAAVEAAAAGSVEARPGDTLSSGQTLTSALSTGPPSSGRAPRSEAPPSQLHERALMALAEQRLNEALRYCRRAQDAVPGNPDYHASSVWIRVAIGGDEPEALLGELDMLLQDHPEHVSARYYRGVLRRRLCYHAAAQRDFERVLQLDPEHEGARAQVSALQRSGER